MFSIRYKSDATLESYHHSVLYRDILNANLSNHLYLTIYVGIDSDRLVCLSRSARNTQNPRDQGLLSCVIPAWSRA